MKSTETGPCCCAPGDCRTGEIAGSDEARPRLMKYLLLGAPLLAAWGAIYWNLARFSRSLVYDFFGLSPENHFSHALEFFVYDTPKVLMLLTLVVFCVGAAIHGYVPEGFMASIMGRSAWWSVPVSVLIGVPMYSNAAGIIPVVHALLEKGAALGTVLAFMMSVIALSLPEAIILRKVLKPRLIGVFFGTVGFGILIVGYFFNLVL